MDGSGGGGGSGGADVPGPEEIARRAQALNQQAGPEAAEGLGDLQKLISAMGLPAAKATFRAMLRASPLPAERLAAVREKVESLEAPPGCMEFVFPNIETGAADKVYMMLDACPRDHDTSTELGKLRSIVSPENWDRARQHLSLLFFYARSLYSQVSRLRRDWIREIFGLGAEDPCEGLLDYQVDVVTSTLFLRADWPERIGFFVRRD